ncbi:Regulatory protein BlaR1 [Rubripirellula tenax]|uniref:Regulatory protein BlaR1 n=2 Tax=Rubripirellula tenax TaxID=2528015 RepID=A0A5C6EI96_9BACT|nr:Regulatory protein BlaR1 [Rubripirellula tenax]
MLWQLFFLDVALKSFVVMAVIAILVGVSTRSSAAIKHRMWTLGIVGVMLVPLWSALLPTCQLALLPADVVTDADSIAMQSVAPDPQAAKVSRAEIAPDFPPANANPMMHESPAANLAGQTDPFASVEPSLASTTRELLQADSDTPVAKTSPDQWTSRLLVVWTMGTVVFILPWIVRGIRTQRWIASGVPVQDTVLNSLHDEVCRSLHVSGCPGLLQCPDLTMPCAAGWFRPVVMLPSAAIAWPVGRLRPVLLHETAHVVRHDMLIQSLAELCRAVYWFNPLVWLAVSRMPLEREQACDDHVLQSGVEASDYAQVLLDVAKDFRRDQRGVGLAMARPNDLPRRMKSLLDKTRSHIPLRRSTAILMLIATLWVSGATSAVRLVAKAQDATADPTLVEGSDQWIEGAGESLKIRVRGEVVNAEGQPVMDPDVKFTLRTANNDTTVIQPIIRGSQFEIWIPAAKSDWYGLNVECQQGDELSNQYFGRNQIRKLAADPMRLRLRKPDRAVSILVTHEDKPVANAKVKLAIEVNRSTTATTDDQGLVDVDLYPNENLGAITAWTDDATNGTLIGGYQFDRQPIRDRNESIQTVELHRCRDQVIRMIDVGGKPIEGVKFRMQVATPPPNFNYLGIVEDENLTTDDKGEATARWFPDWPDVHRYAEIIGDKWFVFKKAELVDDTLVVTLKPRVSRKRVKGKLVSGDANVDPSRLAGVSVYASSFQAEREDEFDARYALTNEEGEFWIDALPGSTYSICVTDPDLVSDYADAVLFDPDTNQANSPTLKLLRGVLATVKLTSGPDMSPIANQYVQFRANHSFKWIEDGKERSGTGGRGNSATTDADGVATALFAPGMVAVNVYQPEWRSSGSLELSEGGENSITLHREISESREVTGRVVMAGQGSEESLAPPGPCELTIGALDGKTRDERTMKTNAVGMFSLNTIATKLGAFAITEDQAFAGSVVSDRLAEPLKITMRPTKHFIARLVDADGKPVIGRKVTALVRMKDTRDVQKTNAMGMIEFPTSFTGIKRIGTTNQRGEVSLPALPTSLPITFYADGQDWQVGEAFLESSETRPVAQWKLQGVGANSSTTPKSNAKRWSEILRNGRLGGYRPLLIAWEDSDEVKHFVNENLVGPRKHPVAARFMSMTYEVGNDTDFETELNVQRPGAGTVTAIAFDQKGTEIDRHTFVVDDANSVEQTKEFLNANAGPKADVQQAWDRAFTIAKKTDRRVWVRIGGRYCGPCFALSRLLDDHKLALSKDFVMLKLDDGDRTDHPDIFDRLTRGQHYGIPFHVIYDANGKRLIDSDGPMGNIGSPSSFEGIKHFKRMLDAGRQRMADDQIDAIVSSIEES